jgi:hypothetical protein
MGLSVSPRFQKARWRWMISCSSRSCIGSPVMKVPRRVALWVNKDQPLLESKNLIIIE